MSMPTQHVISDKENGEIESEDLFCFQLYDPDPAYTT